MNKKWMNEWIVEWKNVWMIERMNDRMSKGMNGLIERMNTFLFSYPAF